MVCHLDFLFRMRFWRTFPHSHDDLRDVMLIDLPFRAQKLAGGIKAGCGRNDLIRFRFLPNLGVAPECAPCRA